MKPSGKKIALLTAIAVVVLLFFADEYPALRFRGDGKFSGGPVFGYWIRLRPIPFYEAGEYFFHFRGLPKEELSVILYPDGKTDKDELELKHLETTLGAKLVDQHDQVICEASGKPLAQGNNANGWVLQIRGDEVAYWHWNCVHLPLDPSASYTLTLRISSVDPKTPRINLLPVVEGGQLDLP
jgi:hypothetical protein